MKEKTILTLAVVAGAAFLIYELFIKTPAAAAAATPQAASPNSLSSALATGAAAAAYAPVLGTDISNLL